MDGAALLEPPQPVAAASAPVRTTTTAIPRLRHRSRVGKRSCERDTRGPYRRAERLSSSRSAPLGEHQPAVGGVVDGGAAPARGLEQAAHGPLGPDVVVVELPALPPGEGGAADRVEERQSPARPADPGQFG